MTTEQFNKAKEISASLSDLKRHLEYSQKERVLDGVHPIAIHDYTGNRFHLRASFLNVDEILLVYRAMIEAEIKKLEKELVAI